MENPLAKPPVVDGSGGTGLQASRLIAAVESIAFWIAVIIPFTYLPILAMDAFLPMKPLIFISLFGTNIIALLAGHNYNPTQ